MDGADSSQRPLVARPRDVGLVQGHDDAGDPATAEGAGVDPLGEPVGDYLASASVVVFIPANAGSSSRLR